MGMQMRKRRAKARTTVVLLVPAKTDAAYFHDYIADQREIRFLKGRMIMTDGSGNSSGRPACGSLLAIYRGPAVKRTEGTGAMSSNAGDTRRGGLTPLKPSGAARRGLSSRSSATGSSQLANSLRSSG